jgi:hypothetical protein
LTHSTGHAFADRIVRGLVTLFEHVFPNRISGYYVEGSYADGSAVATSDLDLTLALRTPFATSAEEELATNLVAACKLLSPVELDITFLDASQPQPPVDPLFKLGARLLYGADIRDTLALLPIDAWARQRMHAAFWLTIHVFRRPQPVRVPIAYPDPADPFYGYASRPIALADGTVIPTTRDLIRVTGWIATARIAYQAQQYVVRKRECATLYRQTIDDEWAPLLERIERCCRVAWHYRIPATSQEQAELSAIGEHVLAFENHFLALYQQFLVSELAHPDPDVQRTALEALGRTWYDDQAIWVALQGLRRSADQGIQTLAHALITRHADSRRELRQPPAE